MDPLDPALFDSDEVRAALAARDVGTVYRLLWRAGVNQRCHREGEYPAVRRVATAAAGAAGQRAGSPARQRCPGAGPAGRRDADLTAFSPVE